MMELAIRPRFYLDIAEEVESLARRANSETAARWHGLLSERSNNWLSIPASDERGQTSNRQESALGAWTTSGAG